MCCRRDGSSEAAGGGCGEFSPNTAGHEGHEGQHLGCKVECIVPRALSLVVDPGGTSGTRGTAHWITNTASCQVGASRPKRVHLIVVMNVGSLLWCSIAGLQLS